MLRFITKIQQLNIQRVCIYQLYHTYLTESVAGAEFIRGSHFHIIISNLSIDILTLLNNVSQIQFLTTTTTIANLSCFTSKCILQQIINQCIFCSSSISYILQQESLIVSYCSELNIVHWTTAGSEDTLVYFRCQKISVSSDFPGIF